MSTDRPNVILIMTDQMRATASHLYGNNDCETPALQRLAGSGVLYENAFTPHPLCVPARVAMWTGRYSHATGACRNETLMPAETSQAFATWKAMGYTTGLLGKNHCFTLEDRDRYFDVWAEISHGGVTGFQPPKGTDWCQPVETITRAHRDRRTPHVRNDVFSYSVSDEPAEAHSTGLLACQTERFLEDHAAEPFTLWVSFPDPHEPREAPRKYVELFRPENLELPRWSEGELSDDRWPERSRVLYEILGVRGVPERQVRECLAVYYGMIRFIDDAVGRILGKLEALGLREKTIVVFCSDHGDFMGEHAMECKGGLFYDCLTRVPLIVSWPGQIPDGQIEGSMANLVDVVPTLYALQGVPIPRGLQGAPLPGATDARPRDEAFSEYGAGGPAFTLADLQQLPTPWGRRALMRSLRWREAEGRRKMIRTREWKYVHDPCGDLDELYDLREDPGEHVNLAADPERSATVADLQRRLLDWSIRTEGGAPAPLPEAEYYDLVREP